MDILLGLVSSDALMDWISDLFHAEITRMTIAFVVAAKLHERAVRKENALMRDSIKEVAEALDKRLDTVDSRLERLEKESAQ